ncbi:MAG: DUF5667 domain-containing protein [Candidatus Woesearchaeota archaeon]
MKNFKTLLIAMLLVFSVISSTYAEENNTTENIGVETTASVGEVENLEETFVEEVENKEIITAENPVTEIEINNEEEKTTPQESTAQETQSIELTENETPSVTPDRPLLWGLKRAIERIDLLLTLGKSAKAQKGLAHARERLLEVQAMIAAKKFEAAEKAAKAHKKTIEEVIKNVEDIGNGDIESEIKSEEQLQQQIAEQERFMNRIKERIKTRLSGEDETNANAIIASIEETTNNAEVRIIEKKNKAEIKLKAKEEVKIEAKIKESNKGEEKEIRQQTQTKTTKESANSVRTGGNDSVKTSEKQKEQQTNQKGKK